MENKHDFKVRLGNTRSYRGNIYQLSFFKFIGGNHGKNPGDVGVDWKNSKGQKTIQVLRSGLWFKLRL